MKKILIGTHNKGKFREIAYLISKKYKKISPISLKDYQAHMKLVNLLNGKF